MKYSPFDSEVELSVQDLEDLQDPNQGPALFETLESGAQRIMTTALMPLRGVLVERFDTHVAPPVQIAWVPDGSVAITRFDGDSVTVGASHMRFIPAVLSAMLRIDVNQTPGDRQPVRTTVGEVNEIVASILSRVNGSAEPRGFLDGYVGGWRCTGGWRNLPTDETMTVVTEADGHAWLVNADPAGDPSSPHTQLELVPIGGNEILRRLRRVVVGTSREPAEHMPSPVATDTPADSPPPAPSMTSQ